MSLNRIIVIILMDIHIHGKSVTDRQADRKTNVKPNLFGEGIKSSICIAS